MQNNNKVIIIRIIIVFVGLVYLSRLFYLQVMDDSLELAAQLNAIQRKVEYPYRGLIYDRNGKLLVYNTSSFDVQIIPKKCKDIDTALVADIFRLPIEEVRKRFKEARRYSSVKPSIFAKQLTPEDFARVQDHLSELRGFEIIARSNRSYPHASFAHMLGYIGEISEKKLKRLERDSITYYKSGDYIGISGLEEYYEEVLRGKKGARYVMVNVKGVEKGSYKEGIYDTLAVSGENIYTSVDLDLQKYAESLMVGKKGSVVALDPRTGEVLCYVSSPAYDPNLLVGSAMPRNYLMLQRDTTKPLFNRPIMAKDAPGSTFKLANALIGLQEKTLSWSTTRSCIKTTVNCHPHPSPCDLYTAIQYSCNPYFVSIFGDMVDREKGDKFQQANKAIDKWRKHIASFGFGKKPLIDLPDAKAGLVADVAYYDRYYGHYRWKYSTIYSISIGQGEVLITPIQLANFATIIANGGYYYHPHIVRYWGADKKTNPIYSQRNYTTIDTTHFRRVRDAMESVVLGGTATTAKIKDISICGKTGTAQNPHGKDHSVFICFAPKDNPVIAMAVFVENAGFGAMTAAPIASLVIEKYIRGEISKERKWWEARMLGTDKIVESKKKKIDDSQYAD